jgi:hypothetical protein
LQFLFYKIKLNNEMQTALPVYVQQTLVSGSAVFSDQSWAQDAMDIDSNVEDEGIYSFQN